MTPNKNKDSEKTREYIDYLQDIFESLEKAEEFIQGLEFEEFKKDEKTIFATIRALEVIGEATKRIPNSLKNRYPDVPWQEMAGIRDKLIHDYFGVNIEVVWNTVKQDLPSLRPQIKRIIEENVSS